MCTYHTRNVFTFKPGCPVYLNLPLCCHYQHRIRLFVQGGEGWRAGAGFIGWGVKVGAAQPVWRRWPILYTTCLPVSWLVRPLFKCAILFTSCLSYKLLLACAWICFQDGTQSFSSFPFHSVVAFSLCFTLSPWQGAYQFLNIPLSVPDIQALPACWTWWPAF